MCNKMSDVRLSNASPTLERVDRRSDRTQPSIRTNLFGTTLDREEFHKEFEDKMLEEQRSFAERWSYDVAKDIPLSSGACEWELVQNRDVPDFYSRPPHLRRCCREIVEFNENHNHYLATSDRGSEPSDAERSEGHSDSDDTTSRPRKRPASSDSSCTSKKAHKPSDDSNDDDDDDDDDDNDEHRSAEAQEWTPIKADPSSKTL